jgi:hypothetical protein
MKKVMKIARYSERRNIGRNYEAWEKERKMSGVVRQKMVRVCVEVRSGTARFRVGVQAEGIRRALSLVGARYPHGETRVVFPIEPEDFFVSEPSATAGMVGHEQVHARAA